MAAKTTPSLLTFLFLLLLVTIPEPCHSLSYSQQFKSLFSLAHSLMTRVANLRASRGDYSGSQRARLIAQKLERGLGLGLWGAMRSVGWDYIKNYAWRDLPSADLYGAASDLNEVLSLLGELTRIDSNSERSAWIARNYQSVLTVANSLLKKLLNVFQRSGVLREAVETVKVEVVDGGLLRDCLELGSGDLIGLVQISKDLVSQFYKSNFEPNAEL